MKQDPFWEYSREADPDRAGKGYVWSTAIGLQAVDGLKPSKYLIDTAVKNIDGEITLKEARELIDAYYEEKAVHSSGGKRTEEADKVSARIAELLAEPAFSLSPNEYRHSQKTVSGDLRSCRKNKRIQHHKEGMGAGRGDGDIWHRIRAAGDA